MIKKTLYALLYSALALGLYSLGYYDGKTTGILQGYTQAVEDFQSRAVMRVSQHVTYCESRNKHEGVKSSKGALGIAQFMPRTFNWMKNLAGHPEYRIENKEDQLALLEWAIANGYGSHWQSCYRSAVRVYLNEEIPNLLNPIGENAAFLRKVGWSG